MRTWPDLIFENSGNTGKLESCIHCIKREHVGYSKGSIELERKNEICVLVKEEMVDVVHNA